jgi:hypothetical protein
LQCRKKWLKESCVGGETTIVGLALAVLRNDELKPFPVNQGFGNNREVDVHVRLVKTCFHEVLREYDKISTKQPLRGSEVDTNIEAFVEYGQEKRALLVSGFIKEIK